MRIVDPHVHIWKNDPAYPWAPETTSPPAEDYTPEMLLQAMAAGGVDNTVLVQVIYYRWDNNYVADAVARYPDKFMAVGRVNPLDPSSPDRLSRWVEEKGIHGVRLSPSTDASGDWFKGPLMPPILARAQALKVPFLLLTGASRLADLVPLLDQHPDLDVVIDHMADCRPEDQEGRRLLMALARYPRVHVKISHTWSLSREEYPWRDTHGLVEEVYQRFGAQRIMWGTDWPMCLAKAPYSQPLSVVREEMKFIAPQDLEWVLGKTALKLWSFEKKVKR